MPDFRSYFANLDSPAPTQDGSRPYINFDNAASTPPLAAALKAVTDFVPWYASVHRGAGYKSQVSTKAYEDARHSVLEFVGADSHEYTTIFTANTTHALNILAHRLGLYKTDVVLISHMEHHSNDLPWRAHATVKRIKLTAAGEIDTDDYLRLLSFYGGRVKVVALTGASNVTGHTPDLAWFARQAHMVGAQFAVDAAQLVAHREVRMGRSGDPGRIDFLAFSAHKMYAPFGVGVLVARTDGLMRSAPLMPGGGTVDFVTKQEVDWASPPERDEAGSPNVLGVMALVAAMRTLQSIGFSTIIKHELALVSHAFRALANVPGLTMYGDARPGRRVGVMAFTIDGLSHQYVADALAARGIGVRSGCFCAHPFVFSLLGANPGSIERVRRSIAVDDRIDTPGLVRISFGLYNTTDEIDAVAQALHDLAAHRAA